MIALRLFVIFLLISVNSFSQGSLSGQVISAENKLGIPFVDIQIPENEQHIVSDSLGRFKFNKIPTTPFNIVFRAYEYKLEIIPSSKVTDYVNFRIELSEAHTDIDEIQIVAAGGSVSTEAISHIEARKISDLNQNGNGNLSEKLSQIPGVYSVSSGTGIAKPIIRGLSGARVVSLLNGQRIENQQWGADHGLGINDLGIGQVEIIKGPASLLYGSDALGGVIYLSDEYYLPQNKGSIQLKNSFETNSLLNNSQISWKNSYQKVRLNLYAGHTSSADYQTPEKKFLKNSAFNETTFKMALGTTFKSSTLNYRATFSDANYGISNETEDSIILVENFYSTTQNRKIDLPFQGVKNLYQSFDYKIYRQRNQFVFQLANARNNQAEFEEEKSTPALDMYLNTINISLKWTMKINEKLELTSGNQELIQFNRNGKEAPEQLIPNYSQQDYALFSLLKGKIKRVNYQLGVRGDYRNMTSENDTKNFFGFNYAGGLFYDGSKTKIHFNVSSGYRAPNVSELYSEGEHHGAARYEIGNSNLKTEFATQFDLTFEYGTKHVWLIVNPFLNVLNRFIYLNKLDSTIGGFQVYEYRSANSAQLYGTDLALHFHPHGADFLHVESNFSLVKSQLSSNSAIPFSPPTRIQTNVNFEINKGKKLVISTISVQHVYLFPQNNIADFEVKTSDYSLFHLSCNGTIGKKKQLEWQIAGRNLLNKKYTPHLSAFRNLNLMYPGINITGSLTWNIGYKLK